MGMKVEVLPASEGDALWVTVSSECGKQCNVLIDGGRLATGRLLVERVKSAPSRPSHLDLLVVTHVDRDHIEGVIELLEQCDESQLTLGGIWFNGYTHLPATCATEGVLEEQGAVMGNRLEALIRERGLGWNREFSGAAVARAEHAFPTIDLAPTLRVTVLGPTLDDLQALRPKWEIECRRARITPDCRDTVDVPDIILGEQASPAAFDFDSLCSSAFVNDDALPNASSIILLFEDIDPAGRSVLFAGDAPANTLQRAMEALRRQRPDLRIDALKVPHHGSDRNVSFDLLRTVGCSDYLISTNGKHSPHPNDAAIARIIRYGQESNLPAALHFNYQSHRTGPWCDPQRQRDLGYTAKAAEPEQSIFWPLTAERLPER